MIFLSTFSICFNKVVCMSVFFIQIFATMFNNSFRIIYFVQNFVSTHNCNENIIFMQEKQTHPQFYSKMHSLYLNSCNATTNFHVKSEGHVFSQHCSWSAGFWWSGSTLFSKEDISQFSRAGVNGIINSFSLKRRLTCWTLQYFPTSIICCSIVIQARLSDVI